MPAPHAALHNLSGRGLISLYTVVVPGGDTYRITNEKGASGNISFGGVTYLPVPVQIEGVDYTGADTPPRPKITISNVLGFFLPEVITNSDMVGSQITRIRVLPENLDGGSSPNSSLFVVPDVFFVNQKISHNKTGIQWELVTSLDRLSKKLPKRQILTDKGFPSASRVRVR